MKKVLVAGATGYLGGYLIKELKKRDYWVRALVRSENQKDTLVDQVDEVFVGKITEPESLADLMKGIDTVFSSVGITRQKDNLTYEDVDYQANMNLLRESLKEGVERFLYVSVFKAQQMTHLKMIKAKERFANALIKSEIEHCIIRPTGFFADMKEVLSMAKKGKVMLFGNGEYKSNPISGRDLAKVCCDCIEKGKQDVEVGGPKVYTQNEIAEAAFSAIGRKGKVSHLPTWIVPLILPPLRLFTTSKFYGPIEFFMTVLTISMETECYGEDLLEDYFQQESL